MLVAFANGSISSVAPIIATLGLSEKCRDIVCAPCIVTTEDEEFCTFRDAALATADQAKRALEKVRGSQLAVSIRTCSLSIQGAQRRHRFRTKIAVCHGRGGPFDLLTPPLPDDVVDTCQREAEILGAEWDKETVTPSDHILEAAARVHEAVDTWIYESEDRGAIPSH